MVNTRQNRIISIHRKQKQMKTFFKALGLYAVATGVFYLQFSLLNSTFDIHSWSEGSRSVFVGITIITLVVFFIVAGIIELLTIE